MYIIFQTLDSVVEHPWRDKKWKFVGVLPSPSLCVTTPLVLSTPGTGFPKRERERERPAPSDFVLYFLDAVGVVLIVHIDI